MLQWWKEVLPPDMVITLAYEDLVKDPEASMRRVFSFLDVPFEPLSLHPEQQAAVITTASAVQLRAPLTTGYLGHWRHYASALEDLMRSMAAARGFLLYNGLLEEEASEESRDLGPEDVGGEEDREVEEQSQHNEEATHRVAGSDVEGSIPEENE